MLGSTGSVMLDMMNKMSQMNLQEKEKAKQQ